MQKLSVQTREVKMTSKQKIIYTFVENHPGSQSGEIAAKLGMALPTTKKILADMFQNKWITRNGIGAGINYTVE